MASLRSGSQGQAFLENGQDRGVAAWNVPATWPLGVGKPIAGVHEQTFQSQLFALPGEELVVVIGTIADTPVCGFVQERMGCFVKQNGKQVFRTLK